MSPLQVSRRTLLTGAAAVGAGTLLASFGGTAAAWAVDYTDHLSAGTELHVGEKLKSPSGQYYLTPQADGNVVLYDNNQQAAWWTGTSGTNVRLVPQTDGNLVVYDSSNRSLWQSGTGGGAATLYLQDDGNLVLRKASDSSLLWTPYSGLSTLNINGVLQPGYFLHNNGYSLRMQGDGNLVLYRDSDGVALWNTGTFNHPGAFVKYQNDGNLVVYLGSTAIWQSGTSGASPGRLQVESYGAISLYSANGSSYWSTGSAGAPGTATAAATLAASLVGKTLQQLQANYMTTGGWHTYSGDWCAVFASWLMRNESGYQTSSSTLFHLFPEVPISSAQSGDVIWYDVLGHSGMVHSVTNGVIRPIEGNCSDDPNRVHDRGYPIPNEHFRISRPNWP